MRRLAVSSCPAMTVFSYSIKVAPEGESPLLLPVDIRGAARNDLKAKASQNRVRPSFATRETLERQRPVIGMLIPDSHAGDGFSRVETTADLDVEAVRGAKIMRLKEG